MSEQDAIAVARRGVEAFNAGDWESYAEIIGPDGTYEELATQRRVVGSQENIEVPKAWKSAFPDSKGGHSRDRWALFVQLAGRLR